MKPVDHVTPVAPSNWVRRPEDKRKKPDQGNGRREPESRRRPGGDPDDRPHHIDELA